MGVSLRVNVCACTSSVPEASDWKVPNFHHTHLFSMITAAQEPSHIVMENKHEAKHEHF